MSATTDIRFVSMAEYLDLPADVVCYEIQDGLLTLTPSPTGPHQKVVMALALALYSVRPKGYVVLPGPLDWVVSADPLTVRQPDLVVLRDDLADLPRIPASEVPLLAVEVISPGSLTTDLVYKVREYGAAGLQHYLVVGPGLPARYYGRERGQLVLRGQAAGSEVLRLPSPFDLDLWPNELEGETSAPNA